MRERSARVLSSSCNCPNEPAGPALFARAVVVLAGEAKCGFESPDLQTLRLAAPGPFADLMVGRTAAAAEVRGSHPSKRRSSC